MSLKLNNLCLDDIENKIFFHFQFQIMMLCINSQIKTIEQKHTKVSQFWHIKIPFQSPFLV